MCSGDFELMSAEVSEQIRGEETAFQSESEASSDGGYETPSEPALADDERPPSPRDRRSAASSCPVEVVVESEIQERIVRQVEWYFSDENILKDSFLMKHIRRNKQGFVSLKLVASFRKVKSLSKDWGVVQASLRHSSVLELNEDGSKVRRRKPVPEVDYSHVARTVIVMNYPDPQPNIHSIETTFSAYGEVTLVRVLYPGKAVPLDVKPCRTKHSTIGKELCILVEFESEEGAKKACNKFNSQQSWRDQVTVALLNEKHHESEDRKDGRKAVGESHSPSSSGNKAGHRYAKEPSPTRQCKDSSQRRQRILLARKGSPNKSRKYLSPEGKEREYSSDSGCSVGLGQSSPRPSRKFFCDQSIPSWRSHDKHTHLKDSHLIRQPLGPDGTRGFSTNITSVSVCC